MSDENIGILYDSLAIHNEHLGTLFTRLALLEGQARDSAAQLKRLPELAAEVDRLHSQLIDCQRRLQALESKESRINGFLAALCEPEEARR